MKLSIPIFPDFIALGAVLVLTLLPIAGHLGGNHKKLNESENRYLATFPDEAKTFKEFAEMMDVYINDNFGWRSEAIKAERKIRGVWGDGERAVYHGTDNWLFWSESLIWDSYLGRSEFSQKHLEGWASLLLDLKIEADKHEASFVATIAPNKVSIYPEYAPVRFGEKSSLNFHDYLFQQTKNEEISFINLKPLLIEDKRNGRIYFKTDTHWTYRGAFIAYHALLKSLQSQQSSLDILAFEALEENHNSFSGDLAKLTDFSSSEEFSILTVPVVDGFFKTQLDEPSIQKNLQTQIHERENSNGKTVVVVGDSFSHYYVDYLKHSFDKIVLVHHKFGNFTLDEVYAYQPDAVIFSPVERYAELIVKNYIQKTANKKAAP